MKILVSAIVRQRGVPGKSAAALTWALAGGFFLLSAGCAGEGAAGAHSLAHVSEVAAGPAAVEGVLRNDIMAAGAQTTGWGVSLADGVLEVDVAKVAPDAIRLTGKRVTVRGTIEARTYVEGRSVMTLVAESIVTAPTGSARSVRFPDPPRPQR
ncbi:hypothetical protein BH11PLA1_BH11PLA1_10470 [soil metagenome]